MQNITQGDDVDVQAIFQMMRDTEKAPDDRIPATGVPRDWEKNLSSIFIDIPEKGYGTCCTTVLLIDYANQYRLIEQNYAPAYQGITHDFSFQA